MVPEKKIAFSKKVAKFHIFFSEKSGPYKFSAFKRPTATSGLGDGQKIFFVWGGEGWMDWGLSRFWLGLENVPQNLKFPVVNTLITLLNYFDWIK